MAAAFAVKLSGGKVEIRSGGSAPAEAINPAAVAAMAELGIDLVGEKPQRFTNSDLDEADLIVTMGCGEECPLVPGKRYEDWQLPDPAGQPLEVVRAIRDEIEERVEQLLRSVGVEPLGS